MLPEHQDGHKLLSGLEDGIMASWHDALEKRTPARSSHSVRNGQLYAPLAMIPRCFERPSEMRDCDYSDPRALDVCNVTGRPATPNPDGQRRSWSATQKCSLLLCRIFGSPGLVLGDWDRSPVEATGLSQREAA